ncbi:MAG: transposase family protein [Parcubacteria group bacterium]|nr:transposase family protein [Parcubacteria group bacterium]
MTTLHVLLIIITGLAVLYSDEQGLEWFRGRQKMLSKKKLDILHVIVSLGLAGIILTGGLMFIDKPAFIHDPMFLAKMVFVAALTINGLLIGSLVDIAATQESKDVSPFKRKQLIVSAAVSVIGWIGATVCGLLLG